MVEKIEGVQKVALKITRGLEIIVYVAYEERVKNWDYLI